MERHDPHELEFGPLYERLRAGLMERLGEVDSQVLVSIVSQHPDGIARKRPEFFSDWPDSYNRNTWYKTWAKAENLGMPPPELGERLAEELAD